jgi:exodeoxyribonuclease V alpha subunit
LESLKGTISRIVFQSEQSGFKVLKLKLSEGPVVTATGEFGPEIIPGTIAHFHGDYKTHAKYGSNFKVTSYSISHNAEEISAIQMFLDVIAPNIGKERSYLIVSHFGKATIDILDYEPDRLTEVEGIGKVSADSLVKAWSENRDRWKEQRQEYSLRAFLNTLGIKERRVKKILAHFGSGLEAEKTIHENPYALTTVEGFGFTTADFIAKKLGFLDKDPMRLKSFILYCMDVECPYSGHLYFDKTEILEHINKYSKENVTTFLDKPEIVLDDINGMISKLVEENLLFEEGGIIYSRKCYRYENDSASMLSTILSKPSDLILLTKEYVDAHISGFEKENGITLSDEQRKALHYFVEKKVFVITGSPGTGKTLVLKAIVSLIKRLGLRLTCMTPTGISAKKLASTIDYEAYTIHRRLGFRGNEWVFNENMKFDTDVVIIDESSMLDQEVFYRMLCALRDRVHIIMVGDHNQLPSVSAGNVLRELINCGQIPTIKLEQIFRQSEASDIIKVAHRIKNGDNDLSLFKSEPEGDVFFIRENDIEKIERFLIKLAQKFKNEKRLFQIISPRNSGPLSVDLLNTVLQNILNPPSEALNEIKCRDFILRKGDRIIIKKNDYENMIYNGDIGKVISITGGKICIDIDGRYIELSVEEIDEKLKLAYSISVHKSQGMEYPYVILPFINQFGKMLLQRNLLYTAITRAKEKVIIIGHGSALERAINNSSVYKRNTKLGDRITLCLQKKNTINSLPTLPGEPETSPVVKIPKVRRFLKKQSSSPMDSVKK